jgi:anti-sigma factor RsiW
VSHLGERLSALIDGELSHHQRERVLAHLANCGPCRQEAAALRMLKQRMHALGEARADTALTDRLIAVAGVASPAPWRHRLPLGRRSVPGVPRRRWPVRSLAVAGLTLAGFGVPAAAFLAGGGQQAPGPSVTPPIDMFVVQHEITAGSAPTLASPSPAGTGAAHLGAAAYHGAGPAPTAPAPGDTPSAGPSGPGVFSVVGVTAALTRVAAASTRVATAATNATTAGSGRGRKPHPAMTAAGAR